MTQVVAGRSWDWHRHTPAAHDPRAAGMTRADLRHWRRMAQVAAAVTPAQKLSEAWRVLSAVVKDHPEAQEYVADVLVTLASATATRRRVTASVPQWALNDALGAGVPTPADGDA